ncbi:hypothetical protein [Candidatus Protochlamydia sp. W-9]|uniref:hypothetical protein n=1 Tax=Candidatus Protochlamydia sp. W-9 TaxID=1785087 RepID=UPI00096A8979|nr:hypothetical protein [Candidatus Protochlamydia sp. W-9]
MFPTVYQTVQTRSPYDHLNQIKDSLSFKIKDNLSFKKFTNLQRLFGLNRSDSVLIPIIDRVVTDRLEVSELNMCSLETQRLLQIQDEIILTRPLKELTSHIKQLKMPRFELIGRVIRTLVLSVFRWHLCGECLLKQGVQITHSLTGRLSNVNCQVLQEKYPYLLENVYTLTIKDQIQKKNEEVFISKKVSPDSLRNYFFVSYEIEITDKSQGNSIYDLLKSSVLSFKNFT